ncbi:uncharacterized protein L201_007025 [Kwoniella dendrophila CBS 6074]|uniref:Uncharacterized protein n=1 Tax=Kwoniella dendrophila CBS 6074 TaxID=1295534 RepID=A0AAX4K2S8_9TREE
MPNLFESIKSKFSSSSSSKSSKEPRSAQDILDELLQHYKPGSVSSDIDPFSSLDDEDLESLGKSNLATARMFHPNNKNFQVSHYDGSRYIAVMERARSSQGTPCLVSNHPVVRE